MSHSTPIRARGAEEASARFARYRATQVAGELRALALDTVTAAIPAEVPDRAPVDLGELAGRITAAADGCREMFPASAALATAAVSIVKATPPATQVPRAGSARLLLLSEAGRLLFVAVVELGVGVKTAGHDAVTANLLQALAEETDPAPFIHDVAPDWRSGRRGAVETSCGRVLAPSSSLTSDDPGRVTCPRCQTAMAAEALLGGCAGPGADGEADRG